MFVHVIIEYRPYTSSEFQYVFCVQNNANKPKSQLECITNGKRRASVYIEIFSRHSNNVVIKQSNMENYNRIALKIKKTKYTFMTIKWVEKMIERWRERKRGKRLRQNVMIKKNKLRLSQERDKRVLDASARDNGCCSCFSTRMLDFISPPIANSNISVCIVMHVVHTESKQTRMDKKNERAASYRFR